jgi:hypothetical protein
MDFEFTTTTWIIAGAVAGALALLLVAYIVARLLARGRADDLKGQFGPEYDRVVQSTGDKNAAERELAGRMERVRSFSLSPLSENQRDLYRRNWRDVQSDFVDHPADAVLRADALVTEVMRTSGYSDVAEGPDRRAADLSVYHADAADDYRMFWRTADQARAGGASTEELRLAMRRLKRVFQCLVEPAAASQQERSLTTTGVRQTG